MGNRPLQLRRRADLVAVPQWVGPTRRWAVKDPVGLNYFHFREDEWFLIRQLDGLTSLEEIRQRFEASFRPKRITKTKLAAFYGNLHESGLVLADQFGQSETIREREGTQRRRELTSAAMNPLAIRIPGVDASRLLDWMKPVGNLLFHPTTFLLVLMAWLAGLVFIIGQSDTLVARIPAMKEYFTGENMILLMVTLSLVKICHELGHALACRHFGGDCHEIGILLLALTPCLYCDVSDVWMMPKRRHRIIVSAAGIYVELILAITCVIVWYFTVPGMLNTWCLNVFLVCSISTLLFNGNPLLRYDGYFILADVVNVPNLFEQSRQATWAPFLDWLAGLQRQRLPLDLPRYQLVLYALASATYRIIVVGTILWVLYKSLSDSGLRPVADVLVALTLLGLLAPAVKGAVGIIKMNTHSNPIQWSRWLVVLGVLAVAGFGIFCLPAPRYLRAPAIVQTANAEHLYIPAAGQIVESLRVGDRVAKGQTVAWLFSAELERELAAAQSETARLARELETLRFRANIDPVARAKVPTVAAAWEAANNRQASALENTKRLEVRSPRAGVVIPGPHRSATDDRELPTWQGSPLAKENKNCFVEAGDLLCLIGEPNNQEVLVMLNPRDAGTVPVGCEVSLRIDQHPGKTAAGTVVEVSSSEVPLTGWAEGSADLHSNWNSQASSIAQRDQATTTSYARVQVTKLPRGICHGSGGFAKIAVENVPLGTRLLRYISRTFQFEL